MKKKTLMVAGAAVAAVGGALLYKIKKAADTGSSEGVEKTTSGVGYTPVGYKTTKQQVEVFEKPQLIQ